MGIFDSAKDKATEFAQDNPGKLDQGVEKAGDFADDKTGGQHADKIDKGQDFASEKIDGAFGGGE